MGVTDAPKQHPL